MSLYTIIKQLQAASGSNAKIAILEANKDDVVLQAYLKATYDPSFNYYQSKVVPSGLIGEEEFSQRTIANVCGWLAFRQVTGHLAALKLTELHNNLNKEGQELLELLIKRSIGAGVGDTMILKVFPDLWFSVPYQRCSLMDDKIKAKFDKQDSFYIQQKLDGSFCYLVKEVGKTPEVITRAGSKYPTEFAQHLAKGLSDGFVLVGELLVYDGDPSMQQPLDRKTGNGILNSILKGGDVDNSFTFQMTAWDCLTVDEFKRHISNHPYRLRLNLVDSVTEKCSFVRPIRTHEVISLEEAYDIYSEFTAQGLEGAVIKTCDFLWKDGTSKDCIKLKIEFECDLEVVAITEGTGKAKGMLGSITLKSSDGLIMTDCGSGFSDQDRQEWWWGRTNRIGSIVSVKANDIISKRDSKIASLFLPIFLEHRLDKTEADSYARCVYQLEAAKGVL